MTTTKKQKPAKPYPTFPLTAHNNGQWCKKIRGHKQPTMFGVWADPEAALKRYQREVADLLLGRRRNARSVPDEITVFELGERYLEKVKREIDSNDRAARGYPDRARDVGRVCRVFGEERKVADLTPDDFAVLRQDIAKTQKSRSLRNTIGNIRAIFNYAKDNHLVDAVLWGTEFNVPTQKKIDKEKRDKEQRLAEENGLENGKRFHNCERIRDWLNYFDGIGDVWFKAVFLFCINTASGMRDVTELRRRDVDLAGGWLDFPRPKTGFARRAKLWPETVAAIRDLLELPGRDEVEDGAEFVFLVPALHYSPSPLKGRQRHTSKRWTKISDDPRIRGKRNPERPPTWFHGGNSDVNQWFKRIKKLSGVPSPFGLYACRHTFQTVAMNATRDNRAVDTVAGYIPPASDMSGRHYQQFIADDHLVAVAEAVRLWLFPKALAAVAEPVAEPVAESVADDPLASFVAIV